MEGKFKYIIIEHRDMEIPIVFSKFLQHNEMANGKTVVSAGFIHVDNGEFCCYGKSVSLRKESRPEDSKIVKKDYEFHL